MQVVQPEDPNKTSTDRAAGYFNRERVRGIEPPLRAWEARVLPLNYTRRLGFFSLGGLRRPAR